jgi:hypothetical protein
MGTRVSAKQYAVPAAMLVVGVAAFVVRQGTEAHWHSQGFVSAFAGLVAGVAFSLGGTFLLTALTGTSFGSRDRPVLEFTAIFVFVTGLTALASWRSSLP